MDVTPLIRVGQQVIQSYAGGRFRVSGQVYESAVIVTPEKTYVWEATGFLDLTPESFCPPTSIGPPTLTLPALGGGNFDVILLGTGEAHKFLPPELKKSLKDKGLNIEAMATGAACRTYNVLMAEGRRVAAALMPAA